MKKTENHPLEAITGLKAMIADANHFFTSDARHYQITFLTLFLLLGSFQFGWESNLLKIVLVFLVCITTQLIFSSITQQNLNSVKSALISALSLCLMLKTNFIITAVIAAFLSIAGKYLFVYKGKHIFNPTNFGIIVTMLFCNDAWISPGQWGNSAFLFFLLGAFGLVVLLKVKRFDTAIAFLFAFGVYQYFRTVVYLGWTTDVFLQSMTSGTLMLFTFFMITDPKTTPSDTKARILWASLVGILAAYLQIHHWVNGSPLWALFVLSPFTPLFDKFFVGEKFVWTSSPEKEMRDAALTSKKINLKPSIALVIGVLMLSIPFSANAFCGFYVAKADASLFNKSSQVILVRDGENTVVTMSSDYTGELKDFAMVVPVPVVLKKSDIRIVERVLFDSFDAYSGPRLVEYWDENPCWNNSNIEYSIRSAPSAMKSEMSASEATEDYKPKVKIEAQYVVGEYDILILSAEESGGLEEWLTTNGYRIPAGARDVLEPYIKSGMKFFVVKVNLEGFHKEGNDLLRPLQIAFHSPKFMLPIRLGMANANGSQDMIVYALSKNGRVETSNYRTVNMPTDRKVPEFIKDDFGKFYKDTYTQVLKREGKRNVFLEYAWDISGNNFMKCDPCSSNPPDYADLINAGATWLRSNRNGTYDGSVYFTRMHVTYDRENFAQDLVFQETPNKQNFQARYILTHPAPGPYKCDEGKVYVQELRKRRYKELQELHSLTNWDISKYTDYLQQSMGYALPTEPLKLKVDPLKTKPSDPRTSLPHNAIQALSIVNIDSIITDSISVQVSEWNPDIDKQQASGGLADKEYGVMMAVLALGFLYYLERRRK